MKITTEEVLEALRGFNTPAERPEGAFTTAEAARIWKVCTRTALQRLHMLAEAGRLEFVRFAVQRFTGDRTMTVTGYRVKP